MTVEQNLDTISEKAKEETETKDEVCAAEEHREKFNPTDYLESFYKTASEDSAMQIVLFFLPGLLYRLPDKIKTVLDLGAGPTVYLPITLRNRAEKIYTSDYSPSNTKVLQNWIENRSNFDWTNVCRWIGDIEASKDTPSQMQETARSKMQAVLEVNVHESPIIKGVLWQKEQNSKIPSKFQVVTTVFCLEYSTETLSGYQRAVESACSLIEDGGYLVQGGVLDATTYNFGGKCFKCHQLQKKHIFDALKKNGMSTEEDKGFKFITHDEIFLLVSRKSMK